MPARSRTRSSGESHSSPLLPLAGAFPFVAPDSTPPTRDAPDDPEKRRLDRRHCQTFEHALRRCPELAFFDDAFLDCAVVRVPPFGPMRLVQCLLFRASSSVM